MNGEKVNRCIVFSYNNWNDYGWYTTFDVTYFYGDGRKENLDSVVIGKRFGSESDVVTYNTYDTMKADKLLDKVDGKIKLNDNYFFHR